MVSLREIELRWYCALCGQPNRDDGKPCGWCGYWGPHTEPGRLMDRGRRPEGWELDRYRDYLERRRLERSRE